MKAGKKSSLIEYYIEYNRFGNPYTVLHLFGNEYSLFIDVFNPDFNNYGSIAVKQVQTNKLKNVGYWIKINDRLELRIKNKGIFYADNKKAFTYNLYNAIPETKKDYKTLKFYSPIMDKNLTKTDSDLDLMSA